MKNDRSSFGIVNNESNQLFRQVRILYLSKTAKTKAIFQENAPGNSLRFDMTATQCSRV